jgi:hypothetical protein
MNVYIIIISREITSQHTWQPASLGSPDADQSANHGNPSNKKGPVKTDP